MGLKKEFYNCVDKQLQLRKDEYWRKQIPKYCPPVLWFGDHNSRDLIVCLALSPSIREFFGSVDDAWMGNYMSPQDRRFYHLNERDLDRLYNEDLYNKVSQSYDMYFFNNPFTKWFGKKNWYNIEGFLNGMNASFYNTSKINAVLIDLIPFVTIDDFSDLDQNKLRRDLFDNNWARKYVKNMLSYLDPSLVLIFGRKTVNYYSKYVGSPIHLNRQYVLPSGRNAYYNIKKGTINDQETSIIGLSTNLGNPVGFTTNNLNDYGETIFKQLP
jgi:hypothetical protein